MHCVLLAFPYNFVVRHFKRFFFQVFMHGHSMVSVYRCIDMSLLPEEYLPDDFEGNCAGNLIDITGKFIHYKKRYMA